jgi:hypothetical protein
MRECLKALRTREETLDDTHRRKKSLVSKAVSADKKLNKMGVDNKNLRQQTDLLMGLHDQIRVIDAEITNEEASLDDLKRIKAREWMGILFGGLLECSEKGAIVAIFGRAVAGYVSTERSQPGLPRACYSDKPRVKALVVEAERRLRDVSFVGEVGDKAERPPDGHHMGGISRYPPSYSSPFVQQVATHPPQPYAQPRLANNPPGNPFEVDDFGGYGPHLRSQTYTPGQHFYPLDQLPPVSPARARLSLPLMGVPPGYQIHHSQSSIDPGPGSPLNYTPPPSQSPFPNIPQTQPTQSGSGSDFN